jgi:hypothetical protein
MERLNNLLSLYHQLPSHLTAAREDMEEIINDEVRRMIKAHREKERNPTGDEIPF